MASSRERGLPPVPRRVDREMRFFLDSVRSTLLNLSGLKPGAEAHRAVRVSDGMVSTGAVNVTIQQGQVKTQNIAKGAVTSEKLADGCVTEKKLGTSSVSERVIMAGAVTSLVLAGGAVTAEKLAKKCVGQAQLADGAVGTEHIECGAIGREQMADKLLPVSCEGTARHGEEVMLPNVWREKPTVCLVSFFWTDAPFNPVPPDTPEGKEDEDKTGGEPESQLAPQVWQIGVTNLKEDGEGSGIWKFTAAGDFLWAAWGYER